jgi:hypothetical protein
VIHFGFKVAIDRALRSNIGNDRQIAVLRQPCSAPLTVGTDYRWTRLRTARNDRFEIKTLVFHPRKSVVSVINMRATKNERLFVFGDASQYFVTYESGMGGRSAVAQGSIVNIPALR